MELNKNAGFWELCFGRNSFLETGISVATYKGSYKQKCKFHSVSLRGYSPVHIILCGVRIANTSEWTLSISADTSEWSLWISADTSEWSLWISADTSGWSLWISADTPEWSLWIFDDTSEWSLWIYLSPQCITVKLCYSESGRPRHIFLLLPSSRYSQMMNLPRETKGNNLGTGAVDVCIINR